MLVHWLAHRISASHYIHRRPVPHLPPKNKNQRPRVCVLGGGGASTHSVFGLLVETFQQLCTKAVHRPVWFRPQWVVHSRGQSRRIFDTPSSCECLKGSELLLCSHSALSARICRDWKNPCWNFEMWKETASYLDIIISLGWLQYFGVNIALGLQFHSYTT